MAGQDTNALGAPAEGFGQTVSFAFDARGDVPTQRPITSQPRGGGVSGGANVSLVNPQNGYAEPAERDPTASLLMKVGEEILGKKLDEQRTVKFVEGMQRAMNGEAIQEVQASVPWYAKIFGDTPAIEGARAYTAAAKVNETIAAQAANMGKLQTLNAADAAKHFSGVINSSLTGDPGTDNVIMKGMTEQMPALMKAQAKSHYAYGQKQGMDALSKNMMTASQGLQAYGEMFAEDKVTEVDMKVKQAAFVASVMPPLGIDEENYVKTLAGNMRTMAASGQFHALDALKKSGVMGALSPEQVNSVEAAITGAATKARNNYAFAFARDIAEIKSDASRPVEGQTPAMLGARIDAMDTKYKRLTGSPIGLFSSDEKADLIAGTFNAIKAQQVRALEIAELLARKNATDGEKQAAVAELQSYVDKNVALGNIRQLKLMKGVTTGQIDNSMLAYVKANPEKGNEALLNAWAKDSYVNEPIKNQNMQPLKMAGSSEVPPEGWFGSVQKFNDLKGTAGGLAFAADYFGDYAKKMERASRLLGDRVFDHPDSARIYQAVSGGTMSNMPEPLSDKERKEVITKVTDLNSNWIIREFKGKTKFRQDTLDAIAEVAIKDIEDWRATDLSDEQSAALGIKAAISGKRLELIGGFAIKNSDAKKTTPTLEELASSPTYYIASNKADIYFERFMDKGIKVPADGNVKIVRLGASSGTEKFSILYKSSDGGKDRRFEFNADQWRAYAKEQNEKDTAREEAQRWLIGNAPFVVFGDPYSEKDRFAADMAAKQAKVLNQFKPKGN
jgi:hypothetical protein